MTQVEANLSRRVFDPVVYTKEDDVFAIDIDQAELDSGTA